MSFIRKAVAGREKGCLFCRVRRARNDRSTLVVARREHAFLMLNRYPYNPGHLMAAPTRHVGEVGGLDQGERRDLLDLVALGERLLARTYRPDGLNMGANVGHVAGAGYPGHLHWHLVPRWEGDTNFMPTIAGTKVLPETLTQTWLRLRAALREVEPAAARRPTRGRKRR
jgi:ATP adenylyltransferase